MLGRNTGLQKFTASRSYPMMLLPHILSRISMSTIRRLRWILAMDPAWYVFYTSISSNTLWLCKNNISTCCASVCIGQEQWSLRGHIELILNVPFLVSLSSMGSVTWGRDSWWIRFKAWRSFVVAMCKALYIFYSQKVSREKSSWCILA